MSDLMSLAISMHRSGGNSKRAKRDADRQLNEAFNASMAEIRANNPRPVPSRRDELLAKAKQTRSYLSMVGKKQARELLAMAEALEREAEQSS